MNRSSHNPSRSLASYLLIAAALAIVGLAARVGQAQVVPRSKGPVQKNAEPSRLNQTTNPGAVLSSKLPSDAVVAGVVIQKFYARREDDKIRVVATLANSSTETSPPVSYLIYRWTGKAWDVIKSGKLIAPLKPQEHGAIVHDMPINSEAMRFDGIKFKLEVNAERKQLAEYQLNAKEKIFVVRFSTGNRWIEARKFFVSGDRNKLMGEQARTYAKSLANFAGAGLEVKTVMYRDDIPFSRDYDTVKCLSANWVERTFASQAEADAFVQKLRGLISAPINIERDVR